MSRKTKNAKSTFGKMMRRGWSKSKLSRAKARQKVSNKRSQ